MKVRYFRRMYTSQHDSIFMALDGEWEIPFLPAIGMAIKLFRDNSSQFYVVRMLWDHPRQTLELWSPDDRDYWRSSDFHEYLEELREAGWMPLYGDKWPQDKEKE
jgi:hypothetical protein